MREFHAVGVRKQGGVGGARHAVQFVGGVGVLVPDDQVGVAALAWVVSAPVGVRPVLVVAFDDGVGGNRNRDDVALTGVVVDDDVHLRRAVAVNDVDRYPVQRVITVGGTIRAPVGMERGRRADMGDDRRGVRRNRSVADVLVPGIVRGKELLAEQRGNDAIFQFLQKQGRAPDLSPFTARRWPNTSVGSAGS